MKVVIKTGHDKRTIEHASEVVLEADDNLQADKDADLHVSIAQADDGGAVLTVKETIYDKEDDNGG